MTGFGSHQMEYLGKKINVEIKTLNGRNTELRFKLPSAYRFIEMDLRKQVMDFLQRGKIEVLISIDGFSDEENAFINADAFRKYFRELSELKNELNIEEGDILQSVLRIPNVIGQSSDIASEDELNVVKLCVLETLKKVNTFRIDEGNSLKNDLLLRIDLIQEHLQAIMPFEAARLNRVKERLRKNMEEFISNQTMDQNRYEQEIVYFLEKLDINEEKVRLTQHCIYFLEELHKQEEQKGRKLSFITQEIGREINTIGAKANDSDVQKFVVLMKDELEKVKEQLSNIL